MKVRFFLRHGAVVDWPVPDVATFEFGHLVKTIRADGYLLAPDCYIPADEIAMIGLEGGSAQIVHPGPMTKQ